MEEEKVIHSLVEIRKKAEDLNNNEQNSKNWLMKSLELISSETVLKNIKKGDKIINKLTASSPFVKKIKGIQEALGYYYFAYYRSKKKDKRARKGIDIQKEKYKKVLEEYVKNNLELKETFEKNEIFLLEQGIEALEAIRHNHASTYRIKLKDNEKAYDSYKKFMDINFSSVNQARSEYKKNFSSASKLVRALDTEIRSKFRQSVNSAEEWVLNEEKLKKASKKDIKTTLKYISYFNTKAFNEYASIINQFFTANLIISFLENDIEYTDYEQVKKFGEKYISLLHSDSKNEAIKGIMSKLNKSFAKYNEVYAEAQFNFLFDDVLPNREYVDKVYLIERLINEHTEEDVIAFLNEVCDTLETASVGEKLFQLEAHIKRCNTLEVSFAEALKKLLQNKHESLQNSYEIKGEFKLEIENIETKQTFVIFRKKEINIGRSRLNDIRINSQYVAMGKHVLVQTENGNIQNGSKQENENDINSDLIYNMSFINGDGRKSFKEVNLFNDKIYELNLGHAFTYRIADKGDQMFSLEPFEDKSNPECIAEDSFHNFLSSKYVMLKQLQTVYLANEGLDVSLEPFDDTFSVTYRNSKLFLEGIDDMPRIITSGDNMINEKYRVVFQTYKSAVVSEEKVEEKVEEEVMTDIQDDLPSEFVDTMDEDMMEDVMEDLLDESAVVEESFDDSSEEIIEEEEFEESLEEESSFDSPENSIEEIPVEELEEELASEELGAGGLDLSDEMLSGIADDLDDEAEEISDEEIASGLNLSDEMLAEIADELEDEPAEDSDVDVEDESLNIGEETLAGATEAVAAAPVDASSGGQMSQADIDKLMSGNAAPVEEAAPAAEPSSGGQMSQADIDKLMSGNAAPVEETAPAAESSSGGQMSQADIDKLMSGNAAPVEETVPAAEPSSGGQMSQADIDKLMSGNAEPVEESAPAVEPSSGGQMSQADIDKLMSGNAAPVEEAAPAADPSSGGQMSQADIDKLMSGNVEPVEETAPAADPSSGGQMSQADIDKLMSGNAAPVEEAAPAADPSSGGQMSQADIDKLMSGNAAPVEEAAPVAAPSSGGQMSQADIDKLMSGNAASVEETAPAAEPSSGGQMSQADIDKLMSGNAAPVEESAPAVEPSSGGQMSQADIDKLMSGNAAPVEETAPEAEPSSGGQMSQADIDKLMSGNSEPAEKPKEEPAGTGQLSQEDIDKMLSGG